jgi:hypothetical protein
MDSNFLKIKEKEQTDELEDKEETEEFEEVCIYEPCQYNFIWYTSWSFLTATCYSMYQEKYAFTIWPGGVFITSLNYWKKPRFNSWERTLDISYVYSSIVYHLFRGIGAENANWCYVFLIIAFLCYLLSNYNMGKKRLYVSALLHSMVHLFANISTICLYSGDVIDTWDNPITQRVLEICENLVD